jgi:hypothetical protein
MQFFERQTQRSALIIPIGMSDQSNSTILGDEIVTEPKYTSSEQAKAGLDSGRSVTHFSEIRYLI